VLSLDPTKHEVLVGPKEALARDIIHINQCNWLLDLPPEGRPISVKFRSVMKPISATLKPANDGAYIHLGEAQYGISPGQAAVCYEGDKMLGGGWIVRTAASGQAA
jgi:tRNA-specific 2-thiouridylase